jgi:hypothetical protein
MKLDLLDGQHADVLDDNDIAHLPNRERRRIVKTWDAAQGSAMDKGLALTDSLIALVVTGWSLPHPLPRDSIAVLEEIPGYDYDVLSRHALEMQGKLYKSFEVSPDPKVITDSSNGSGGHSNPDGSTTVVLSPLNIATTNS